MNPSDTPESMFRSVGEAEVSLDEMLSLACRQGKQDIVELLLESGAKVNYRNKAGNTPLLEACSQGHVNIARLLLEKKADIDAPTETTSDSALTWACTLGNEDIVQLLLEHKACIEHRTRDGCTALMFAALAGHDKVAKLLLGHCAELNVESDSNKDSPLTFACWKGHIKVVEIFLIHGANIEHRTKEGFSPLMFAALGGHTEVAQLLLEKKAEVNQPSGSNNDIPLTSACWKGHHDVVELLLCYQSNIEHHTKDGCTPLMLAAREGHLTVAQLLLNHNARVNVPSGSENNIPLTLACWKGHKDVVELLLNYKSNIEHQNKAGCTPLMLAAREGHFEATELLLDHGANLNIPSGSNDDTPLTLACWKGHDDVVTLLLERQSSINHQTKTGCTPLMEATREGHISVAKMLLEAGADVETPDNYGQTPFFMACWKGHAEVAALLLDYGANKDCKTKTGITPFFQACRENHVEVVKLLLDYGCNPSTPFPNSRECPLTLAAEKGFSELTEVLLSRSANVECRTKKGCTPLFLTCKEGFKEIAIMLSKHGAETESSDYRGVTPLLAAFKNGYVEVVDWLLSHATHLPSDLECQKALMAPRISDKDVLPQRSKCLELIMKAKKAREQAALKNAQILFEELDAEKEKKELRKKAAQRKKAKRKERKRKGQERGKSTGANDDEEEYEEEEETVKNTSRGTSPTPADPTHFDEDDLSLQSKAKNKNKNSKTKRPVHSSTQSSSHPVSMVTETERTNHQSPVQAVAENWEDEETEDEMFVDAPEFPELKAMPMNGPGNSKTTTLGNGPIGKSQDTSADGNPSKRPQKSMKKTTSASSRSEDTKPPPGPSSTCTSKKSSRSSSSSSSQPTSTKSHSEPVTSNGEGSRGSKEKRVPADQQDSDKHNSKSKSLSTKWSSRSESPSNSTNRSVSSSSTGTRGGSYVACVDNEDEESDSWNIQLEPCSSDWTNEGFKSQSSRGNNSIKSWASVSTAPVSVSSSSSGHTSTTSSTSLSHHNSSTGGRKPWHEVSPAITTFQMTVSNSLVGRIIGKKGLKINQIQANSGAQISISRAIPRSVDRLITIKGTERSVRTAQDLIEEALSTPSKDLHVHVDSSTTDKSSVAPTTKPPPQSSTTTTSSSQPVCNPWNHTPFTPSSSSPWGQKRYSDIVPPVSLIKPNPSSQEEPKKPISASPSTRRASLPVTMLNQTSQEIPASLGNLKCGGIPLSNSTNTINTPAAPAPDDPPSTASSTTQNSIPMTTSIDTEAKDRVMDQLVTTGSRGDQSVSVRSQPRHSVTLGPLSSVKEDEEGNEELDPPKQKRSLSDPLVLRRPVLIGITDSPSDSGDTPDPPRDEIPSSTASSVSTPLVTVTPAHQSEDVVTPPSTPPPATTTTTINSVQPTNTPSSSSNPSVAIVTPTPSTNTVTTRTTRTVGIVTPTQSVKLFQHDTTTSVSSSLEPPQPNPPYTTASNSSPSSSDLLAPPTPGGTFGAIGPPPRRNSLPVSTGNHFENSPRKLSYAGMHQQYPGGGGSLSMVPESPHPVNNQPRGGEYQWNPPPPMQQMPPPPPHPPMSPWNNHGGSMDWSRPGFPPPPPAEYDHRMRSQSWAGLGPSSGGFINHHPMEYPPANQFPSQPPLAPPPHVPPHVHSQWGKFHPNHMPPPFVPRPPHSNFPPHLGAAGFNFSNYRNDDRFSDGHRHIEPHPSNYHSQPRFSSNNSSSQPAINEISSPMSLRQVLGELEGEIFSGGTPVMDSLMKEESPAISKRWSVSSVTPTVISNPDQPPHIIQGSSSSVWNPSHSTLRHSVSSPFQQRQHEVDQPLISDLAASWPIWTTPTSSSSSSDQQQQQQHLSQSASYTPPSSGAVVVAVSSDNSNINTNWSNPTDLANLMKQLDIEEHTATLQNRGINLERLLNMSDEEWRDLLPMGPRVKLMNAINRQLQDGEKITGSDSDQAVNDSKPFNPNNCSVANNTHKCSPFVQ